MLPVLIFGLYITSVLCDSETVLVLGGQGLAGSATLTALLESKFQVSALNDDKNYYDYHDLFQDKIESIVCIRPAGLDGCFELQNFLKSSQNKIKAIVDFTSSSKELMEEAVRLLSPLNPEVYIFVSAAAVYDVSHNPKQPLKEVDAVRPVDPTLRAEYSEVNEFGHKMLGSEEALIASGLPYVILRCGDLIGPRDTTYRWWQYQVWSEHFDIIQAGFPVPGEFEHLPFSLTYGGDVARAVVSVIDKRVVNEVYNIAMEKTFTLPHYLLELCTHFGKEESCWADYTATIQSYSLYPSNHMGTMSTEHAKIDLDFQPSSWEDVLRDTVTYYEKARHNHTKERDIVLSRLNENVVPYLRVEKLNEAVLKAEEKVVDMTSSKPELNRVEL